jgi:hypothetical protein
MALRCRWAARTNRSALVSRLGLISGIHRQEGEGHDWFVEPHTRSPAGLIMSVSIDPGSVRASVSVKLERFVDQEQIRQQRAQVDGCVEVVDEL